MESLAKKALDKNILIWDFDGTLVKLNINWRDLKKDLVRLSPDIKADMYLNDMFRYLVNHGKQEVAFQILSDYESHSKYSVNYDALDVIKEFKDKKMAIFSDNMHSTIVKILRELDMADYFGIIVGKDDVTDFKPSADGLVHIKNYFKIDDINKCLFIGDSDKDAQASKNFGVDFYQINF